VFCNLIIALSLEIKAGFISPPETWLDIPDNGKFKMPKTFQIKKETIKISFFDQSIKLWAFGEETARNAS